MHRGRGQGVTMTPRGGLDRGGMGVGGRRPARSGWDPSDVRGSRGVYQTARSQITKKRRNTVVETGDKETPRWQPGFGVR